MGAGQVRQGSGEASKEVEENQEGEESCYQASPESLDEEGKESP